MPWKKWGNPVFSAIGKFGLGDTPLLGQKSFSVEENLVSARPPSYGGKRSAKNIPWIDVMVFIANMLLCRVEFGFQTPQTKFKYFFSAVFESNSLCIFWLFVVPERKNAALAWLRPPYGGALNWAGVLAVCPLPLHVDALLRRMWACTFLEVASQFLISNVTWGSVLVLHQGFPLLSTWVEYMSLYLENSRQPAPP